MKNIKQINIYLVDGSRYVVIPSDDNFYGGYNIGISKNEAKSIIHEWVFGGRRQLSPQVSDVGITASNIISIELLEHEE